MNNVCVLIFVILLCSCVGPKPTSLDVELERYRMQAVIECYKSKSSSASLLTDARDQALVIMAEALANQGKQDTCAQIAGTNAHEARARIAEAQNSAFGNITGTLVGGAVTAAGIVVAGDVLKESVSNAGNKTNITGDRNVGERDMSTTQTYTMPQAEGSRTSIQH